MSITTDAPPTPQVSRTDLTERALSDPRLSPGAQALLHLLVRLGRPVSADTVWANHLAPGGREAIRARMRELKTSGYVTSARHKDTKRKGWFTAQDFAEVAPEVPEPVDLAGHVHRPLTPSGPGVLFTSLCNTSTVTGKGKAPLSAEPTEDPTPDAIGSGWDEARHALESRYRRATAPQGRAPRARMNRNTGPGTVPWKGARKMRREPDASLGGDIDVSDPFATTPDPRGRVKPVRTARTTDTRTSKPEASWNSYDLTAEFNSRAYEAGAGDFPHQINSTDLSGALRRLIRNGSRPDVLAACIKVFFADPRNLYELGTGAPIWKRFLADLTQGYGKAQRALSRFEELSHASDEPSAPEPDGLSRVSQRKTFVPASGTVTHTSPATPAPAPQQPQDAPTAPAPVSEPWLVTLARIESQRAEERRLDLIRQHEALGDEPDVELDAEEEELA